MKACGAVLIFIACVDAFYFKRTINDHDGNDVFIPPGMTFTEYHGNPFDVRPYFRRVPSTDGPSHRLEVMSTARPGAWRHRNIVENINRHLSNSEQLARNLAIKQDAIIRSKFAALHRRLIEKNRRMADLRRTTVAVSSTIKPESSEELTTSVEVTTTSTATQESTSSTAASTELPKLSKKAMKIEKNAKKIMENKRMSIEKKQKKLDKLMRKVPESVKAELIAMNDANKKTATIQPGLKSQKEYSIVESKSIRISPDGETIEI